MASTVYKIRRKSDGLFSKKCWEHFDKKGFTFKSRSSLTIFMMGAEFELGKHYNDCEVVTFELTETESTDLSNWKKIQ